MFTNDSSVCSAAVLGGQITLAAGGTVVIELRPGERSYRGSSDDGMTSMSYGSWATSFTFPAPPRIPSTNVGYGGAGWDAEAYNDNLGFPIGQELLYICPAHPRGSLPESWGTGTYTGDSSVCAAAVHAGKLTTSTGGTVVIELERGASSYRGSAQNGVTSNDYGQNGDVPAFVFVMH